MTVIDQGNEIYLGLSTDTKPTSGIPAGARFIETDTAMLWQYNGSIWSLGKYTIPTPNIVRIGVFDGGTGSNVNSYGIVATGASRLLAGSGAGNRTASSSTEGQAFNGSTGTTASSYAGFGQGNAFASPATNLYWRARFRCNSATTNSTLWIGITSTGAAAVASNTPLASQSGVMFGYAAGATNFTVIQNNGGASQYDNLVSTTSFPVNAVDTNWHTFELYTLDNGSHFQYSLDGATAFQLATTQLPTAANSYQFFGIMSNLATTTSSNWDSQYCWLSMSPNNK